MRTPFIPEPRRGRHFFVRRPNASPGKRGLVRQGRARPLRASRRRPEHRPKIRRIRLDPQKYRYMLGSCPPARLPPPSRSPNHPDGPGPALQATPICRQRPQPPFPASYLIRLHPYGKEDLRPLVAPLPVACCLLPVACCLLPVACCPLPVACFVLPLARCLLPVARCLFFNQTNPLIRPGAIKNAVCVKKTKPIEAEQSHSAPADPGPDRRRAAGPSTAHEPAPAPQPPVAPLAKGDGSTISRSRRRRGFQSSNGRRGWHGFGPLARGRSVRVGRRGGGCCGPVGPRCRRPGRRERWCGAG